MNWLLNTFNFCVLSTVIYQGFDWVCCVWADVVSVLCRPPYNSGPRVFSNRTCITPPSTDAAIHSLSDESETVRFIAYGKFSHLVTECVSEEGNATGCVCLSVCPFVHLFALCNFWNKWHLMLTFCVHVGHDHSFPGNEGQGRGKNAVGLASSEGLLVLNFLLYQPSNMCSLLV